VGLVASPKWDTDETNRQAPLPLGLAARHGRAGESRLMKRFSGESLSQSANAPPRWAAQVGRQDPRGSDASLVRGDAPGGVDERLVPAGGEGADGGRLGAGGAVERGLPRGGALQATPSGAPVARSIVKRRGRRSGLASSMPSRPQAIVHVRHRPSRRRSSERGRDDAGCARSPSSAPSTKSSHVGVARRAVQASATAIDGSVTNCDGAPATHTWSQSRRPSSTSPAPAARDLRRERERVHESLPPPPAADHAAATSAPKTLTWGVTLTGPRRAPGGIRQSVTRPTGQVTPVPPRPQ
jgi:hypothetical protein